MSTDSISPSTVAAPAGIASTSISQLAAAQTDICSAAKDAKNPHFGSSYATLASVQDACRAPLSRHGLAIMQIVDGDTLRTILAHKSGEWVSSTIALRSAKNDMQGLGSAITYARRYALAALVGVSAEDDDGNAASRRTARRDEQEPQHDNEAALPIAASASADQIAQLRALEAELGEETFSLAKVCAAFRASAIEQLNIHQAQQAISRAESRRRQACGATTEPPDA